MGRLSVLPESRLRQVTDSRPVWGEPVSPAICVFVRSWMLSVAAMRSIKYFDMLAARLGPRTSIHTFDACAERNTAACPAEVPPPTTTTSSPAHIFASIGDAQYHTPCPSIAARFAHSGRR